MHVYVTNVMWNILIKNKSTTSPWPSQMQYLLNYDFIWLEFEVLQIVYACLGYTLW